MTFHEDGDVVSVWVGSFESRADLEAYLHPFYSPGPDTDDLPLSAFAADVGLPWYDEDFLEADCCLAPIGDLAAALEGFSYSSSFAAAVAAAVSCAAPFNTFLLLYGYNHSSCGATPHPTRVRFLGTFPYDPNAR